MKTLQKTALKKSVAPAPFAIRRERASDVAAREQLLDLCFGENRFARTCQRIRDGRLPAEGLAFTAVRHGRLVGTLRLWHVAAGGRASLMLGPLAVDPKLRSLGIGAALMRHAIVVAAALGYESIVLLGDAPYYERFGFSAEAAKDLVLPGPFERERMLGLELRAGALAGATGMILPTGKASGEAALRQAAKPSARRTARVVPLAG
jgi:predicted N-acetyltransferase YhbS